MVKWSFPGCLYPELHRSTINILRSFAYNLFHKWRNLEVIKVKVWVIVTILTLDVFTFSLAQVNNHNHVTAHTVNTKYGALRGLKLQFSSSSTKHLGEFLTLKY